MSQLEPEALKLYNIWLPKEEDEDCEDEGEDAGEKAAKDKSDKENEGEPSREVTNNGFSIIQAGLDRFVLINQEQSKCNEDKTWPKI